MRIFLAIKFHPNHQNRELIDAICVRLESLGHSTVCVARDFERWGDVCFGPRDLLFKAFKAIEECDLVLVEATEKGMGVGVEAGYAFARNIPLVTIVQPKADLSLNLQCLSSKVIVYHSPGDILLNEASLN